MKRSSFEIRRRFLGSLSFSPAILLVAAIVRRADWLALSALFGAGLVEVSWQAAHFSNEQAIPALGYYGLFLIFFVAFPFCSAQKEKAWSWAISAIAQALQFWLFYRAIDSAFPNEWMGLLPAAFVVPAAIGVVTLLKLYRADPGDRRRPARLAGRCASAFR